MAFPKPRGLLLVIVLILTLGDRIHSQFVFVVSSCPSCKEDWKKRSDEFKCDANKTLSYHCIINSEEQLIETCMTKTKILPNTEGCPRVVVHTDGLAYHDFVFSNCLTNMTHCPRNHSGYWTDELYMYPVCFIKESNRHMYQGDDCKRHTIVQIDRSNDTPVWVVTLPVVAMVVATVFVLALYIYLKRKRNERGQSTEDVVHFRIQDEGPSDAHTSLLSNQISEHMDLMKFILLDKRYGVESLDRHLLSNHNSCEYCKRMALVLFAAELSCRNSFTYLAEKMNFKFKDNEMAMKILSCCIRNKWMDLVKEIIDSYTADEKELNATVQSDKRYVVVTNKEMKNVLRNLKEREILIMDDLELNETLQEMKGQFQHIQSLILMT